MTDKTPQTIPQREFTSLDEFKKLQNNFYFHFLSNVHIGKEVYRKCLPYIRFQEKYPTLEIMITELTTKRIAKKKEEEYLDDVLPYEELLFTYKLMSQLVHADDPFLIKGAKKEPDDLHLTR